MWSGCVFAGHQSIGGSLGNQHFNTAAEPVRKLDGRMGGAAVANMFKKNLLHYRWFYMAHEHAHLFSIKLSPFFSE